MLPHDPNREELRIALVMNGGVSLAIWIGGLTLEVNRVVRRQGAYGELLDLLAIAPKVDVISGTSAGGINGAFLALAMVRDQPLDLLQQLWVEKGAFGALLRDPLDPLPSSLLRGDEYFLHELGLAFAALASGGRLASPEEVPVDLTLTTTLLNGEFAELSDDFGRAILDVKHAGRFVFRRDPSHNRDDFAGPAAAARLALAARSTSSFPFAFEPSFVPVTPPQESAGGTSMKGIASFKADRFVVDGGLLDNKPLGPALEAIYRQHVTGDARRVLLYVIPDPSESGSREADPAAAAPEVREVLIKSLFEIPRSEPVKAEIDEIRKSNRRALELRDARLRLTTSIGNSPEGVKIWELSSGLFPVYQERRRSSSISYIVSQLSDGLAERAVAARSARVAAEAGAISQIWLERQSHRAWLAQAFRDCPDLPWVPREHPLAASAAGLGEADWCWGIRAVEQAAAQLADLLQRTQAILPLDHSARQNEGLPALWKRAWHLHAELGQLRRADMDFWKRLAPSLASELEELHRQAPADAAAANRLHTWVGRQLELYRQTLVEAKPTRPEASPAHPPMGNLALRIAQLILEVATLSRAILPSALGSPVRQDQNAAEDLQNHLAYLVPLDGRDPGELLLRLSWLEVVQSSLGSSTREPDQLVELMQVSANIASPWGGPERAADKLTGVQLGHFGAFYRRSWRANDWMYGRLDGANNLVQAILSPERLRRLAVRWPLPAGMPLSRLAFDKLAAIARGHAAAAPLAEELVDQDGMLRELAYLDHLQLPAPDALPLCCDAIIRRLQLEILESELVSVADAAALDEAEADLHPGPSSRLQLAVSQALARKQERRLEPADALRIFRTYRVGEEKIRHQAGSDFFTTTTAQTMAVAASVLYKGSDDLGVLKNLFRIVRAVALAFHLMSQNLSRRSRTGAALLGAALAASATVLALKLAGAEKIPGAVTFLAASVGGAAILVALFRSFVGALLAAAGFTLAYFYLWPRLLPQLPWLEPYSAYAATAVLLLLLLYFGSLRRPRWWARLRARLSSTA